MNKTKTNFCITALLLVIFIIFTVSVKAVDVAPIGPENSEIGFSALNKSAADFIGQNDSMYDVSEIFGYVALLTAAAFGAIGVYQLIKRKSIFKIDTQILITGAFYVLVVIAYAFFEVVVVNYRPVLIEGVLEASYPSSHTMLALCLFGSAMLAISKYLKGNLLTVVKVVLAILMISTVFCRLLSGVHWLTDIIGGVLISCFLVMLYYSVSKLVEIKKEK